MSEWPSIGKIEADDDKISVRIDQNSVHIEIEDTGLVLEARSIALTPQQAFTLISLLNKAINETGGEG